ncbi:inhibitor of growth protein 3-like isoform X2 [Ostrea edulis]|uniref:inhibitor of growth protein 3-like isoform X2 n=1 Tax=Ostrea edulis TaxID=37623 RepID=UPI002094617E|nr:inhibitor of growth protein 3-like isoform X2 [Ostrea edulis]
MLYLEDYLEMIENLPMEMRERLTEMREMDLQVQNALDNLDERVKNFFKKCTQPNMKMEWKDEQFKLIKQEYYKTLEDADEKVQLANHIYDLVDRHLRKLDQELSKFKMELEADNAGITEVLEKRSLELDKPPSLGSNRGEKRKLLHSQSQVTNHTEKRMATEKVLSTIANEAARETINQTRRQSSSGSNSPALSMFNSTSTQSISYSLGHMGAGSNAAIAAAASQAIAATQQVMGQQGRRTPSMKASYVAMAKDLTKELPSIAKEYTYSSQPSTPTSVSEITPKVPRSKKATSKANTLIREAQNQLAASSIPSLTLTQPTTPQTPLPAQVASPMVEDATNDLQIVDENGQPVDWQNDPNEPRYCLCNQVSYGDMVGCDNDDCPIEWFHYGCVGLTQAPKGKWFCPQCTAAIKRRGRRN